VRPRLPPPAGVDRHPEGNGNATLTSDDARIRFQNLELVGGPRFARRWSLRT
jgi:hypothetical protein